MKIYLILESHFLNQCQEIIIFLSKWMIILSLGLKLRLTISKLLKCYFLKTWNLKNQPRTRPIILNHIKLMKQENKNKEIIVGM
jgi:hypothetical protein